MERGVDIERRWATDEDEGEADAEGEHVAAQGLVVLAVAFGEDAQARVDVVLAQCLKPPSHTQTQLLSFHFDSAFFDIMSLAPSVGWLPMLPCLMQSRK